MSDLIDRQAAIDAVRATLLAWSYMPEWRDNKIIEAVEQLPPIQPKRGRWERHYSRPNVLADLFWHCSECGYKDSENYAPVYHHFCTNCGAKMEVNNESN